MLKEIGHWQGKGTVSAQTQEVATVSYDIREQQRYVTVRDTTGTYELPGQKRVTGTLQILTGSIETGEELTLHLQDGRDLPFYTVHHSLPSNVFQITARGILTERAKQP